MSLDCEGLGPVAARYVLGRRLTDLAGPLLHTGETLEPAPGLAYSPAALALVLRTARALRRNLDITLDAAPLAPILAITDAPRHFAYRVDAGPVVPMSLTPPVTDLGQLGLGSFAVVDAWALPITHWTQLLWANLLGLGPALWQRLGAGPSGAFRVSWAALRAGSLHPERLARFVNVQHPGAFVHPTATVEASVIGPKVRIGPGAVVRGAWLGEGAQVEELSLVVGSVVGDGARVQRQAMVKFSLMEPNAAAAGVQQLCVLGDGSAVKRGAVLMDQRFSGPVRVAVGGRMVEAPHGVVGVCVGPGAVVGSGVLVAAGRVVPAGLTVVAREVLSRVNLAKGIGRVRADGGLDEVG